MAVGRRAKLESVRHQLLGRIGLPICLQFWSMAGRGLLARVAWTPFACGFVFLERDLRSRINLSTQVSDGRRVGARVGLQGFHYSIEAGPNNIAMLGRGGDGL